MKYVRCLSILLLLGLWPSCAYLTDRGVDFLDQYRAVVGTGTGGGIRMSALGLYDTGLIFGLKPKATSFGWKYGRPFLLGATGEGLEADQSWIVATTRFENWQMATSRVGRKR